VVPPHLPASFVSDFLRDSWDVQLHMFNNTLLGGAHALDPAYQVQPPAHTPSHQGRLAWAPSSFPVSGCVLGFRLSETGEILSEPRGRPPFHSTRNLNPFEGEPVVLGK
jgi:hypothetical protein